MSNPKEKAKTGSAGARRNGIQVECAPGETEAATLAYTGLRTTVQAGITATKLIEPYFPEQDLGEVIKSLSGQVRAAAKGDLSRTEAMLVTQATTLDLLFHKLTRQAIGNIGTCER